MTRTVAIDLVREDLSKCERELLTNVSEFTAMMNADGEWEVVCKLREPITTPLGQKTDTITYLVEKDGTVLICPE